MAQLIRDSYHSQVHQSLEGHRPVHQSLEGHRPLHQSLEGHRPLQLLVEIGIEKLSRDLSTAFLATDLVTAGHLDYFLTRSNADTVRLQTNHLEKLYQVLEIVTVLDQYLNLPRLALSAVARQTLKYYECNDIKSIDIFRLVVNPLLIASHLKGNCPKSWKATCISSCSDNDDIDGVVLLTDQQPYSNVHHTTSTHMGNENGSGELNKKSNFMIRLRRSKIEL